MSSLEEDQQICQYFECEDFDFAREVVNVLFCETHLFVVTKNSILRHSFEVETPGKEHVLQKFKGEVVTMAKFNVKGTFVYLILERQGGQLIRLACVDLRSSQVLYSNDFTERVRDLSPLHGENPFTVFTKFKKRIERLDFESSQIKPIYLSRRKIKFFGFWRQADCLILNESRKIKFVSQDGKLVSMLDVDDFKIKLYCTGNSFCIL